MILNLKGGPKPLSLSPPSSHVSGWPVPTFRLEFTPQRKYINFRKPLSRDVIVFRRRTGELKRWLQCTRQQ